VANLGMVCLFGRPGERNRERSEEDEEKQ
jgi:hypothetical protein